MVRLLLASVDAVALLLLLFHLGAVFGVPAPPPREPPSLLVANAAFPPSSDPTMPFDQWNQLVKKPYRSVAEMKYREDIYNSNLRTIRAHNGANLSWTMGVNVFSDLSEAEFEQVMLLPLLPQSTGGPGTNEVFLPVPDANASIDWRTKGAVTPVKNQLHCGACWAFGTVGSIEGANFLAGNKLTQFSEQQLVDCSLAEGTKGCKGGDAVMSYKYISSNKGGLDTEADYPYQLMAYDKKPPPVFPCNTTKAAHRAVVVDSYQR